MALHCNHENCDEATVIRGSRDGEGGQTVEKYECAKGHVFHTTVQL
jgi:hypothetical protein